MVLITPSKRCVTAGEIASAAVPMLDQFFAFSAMGSGVTVGASELDSSGMAEILTGATNAAHFRAVAGNATGTMPPAVNNIDVVPPSFDATMGVTVGG